MTDEILKFMRCFQGSFINNSFECICDERENVYFRLEDVKNDLDLKVKIFSWLSRPASIGTTKRCQTKILNGINMYIGSKFTQTDMELIYTYLGNACNRELCIKFIEGNYNLEILKNYE